MDESLTKTKDVQFKADEFVNYKNHHKGTWTYADDHIMWWSGRLAQSLIELEIN